MLCAGALSGQSDSPRPPETPLSLGAAVEFAIQNYPAIRVSLAEAAAAEGGVDLARTAYLPRAAMHLGVNRATRNNVFGMIFPNGVIPAISGPVQDESTITSTFGSAAGMLFSWEPFDFGLRQANVRAAEAVRARARAGLEVTRYQVALAVADAYLQALAHRQAVSAAEATEQRMQVFLDAVGVLARVELRPGADESRARAELARATAERIRAEQEAETALATLAEWLGLAGRPVTIVPGVLLGPPPAGAEGADAVLASHPLTVAQRAETDAVAARLEALAKQWRPRFEMHSAVFGRGTGARVDGTFQGRGSGLAPSEGNWGVGFGMTWDLVDLKENRVRRRIEAHNLERERAEQDLMEQSLLGEIARAEAALDGARKLAATVPIELEAARTLETQAQARYRAGLAEVTEVAEVQRLLRQAEIDNALAHLGVWRALFALAAARGDIDDLVGRTGR